MKLDLVVGRVTRWEYSTNNHVADMEMELCISLRVTILIVHFALILNHFRQSHYVIIS